ncbi:MAG: hypothetical protein F4W68_02175 [Cenarchaeum sp. SB0661_bin_35]|nr:hypothetical protein [Cenarchaeum sp. SB0662_bin_33]MYC79297.1 hypothetical protein [Cenarchaeum sp. SB0661_bin_35]
MGDIIWGNGSAALSNNTFVLNVTHRKNENKNNYTDSEKIIITSAELPGMPHDISDWTKELLDASVAGAFLKCEVKGRNESGTLLGKVSHSGAGGY